MKTITKATTSLVLGVFSIFLGWIPFVGWALVVGAILLGWTARKHHSKNVERSLATAGIITGAIGAFFAVLVGLLLLFIPSEEVPDTAFSNVSTPQTLLADTPENAVISYLSLGNYSTSAEGVSAMKNRRPLSGGFMLDANTFWVTYFTQTSELARDWRTSCTEMNSLVGQDSCTGSIADFMNDKNEGQRLTIRRVVLESQTDGKATVDAEYTRERKLNGTWSSEDAKVTFYLENQTTWTLVDFEDSKQGRYSEYLKLDSLQKEWASLNEKLRASQKEYANLVSLVRNLADLQNKASAKAKLTNKNLITVTADFANNRTDQYVLSVNYYFDDVSFADDYLQISQDATDFVKALFPLNNGIQQIQITAIERYTDDYGNSKERTLSKVLMTREVYTKINWQGFEYENLGKITPVNFYGDSMYKSLVDLQNSLDNWKSSANSYVHAGGYGTIPSEVCGEAESQCETYDECDTYWLLQSQGIC